MALPMRKDVPVEMTWDLDLIYPTEEAMYEDAAKMEALSRTIADTYKGKLTTAEAINACVDQMQELAKLQTLVWHYNDLAASVDYTDAALQERNDKMMRIMSEMESRLSFVESEIIQQPEDVLQAAIAGSAANAHYLKGILRKKAHQLSPETEEAFAALSQTFNAPNTIYNVVKLADMQFPSFTVDGKEYPLSYSLFEDDYEYEKNTAVRRAAFENFSKKIREYTNVTGAAYNIQVQTEKTMAGLRGFDSVFDSLLFPQDVSLELYNRQIDLITTELAPHMRKFAKLLQRVYKLDKMTFADLKLNVDPDYAPPLTIKQAQEYCEKGLSILGEDYVAMVTEAFENRWFDLAQNVGKSTGGFCASPYDRGSFILMTWNARMADVFTMAHELGHAGHFKACNAAQSIYDTDVSSYFVESPSTMNEMLMSHYLLKTSDDKRFRRWVLSNMISNTYYHNFVTHLMEAAYQREVYKIVDAGGSVQAETLSQIMHDTLAKFWGDAVELPEGAELTWMRQPHYYMGLYSYTYSAGLTIATQVCKRIEKEGQPAVDDWKKVLKAGSTGNPVELAQMAGVDITTDEPLRDTIAYIGSVIDEIIKLTDELEAEQ